MIAVGYRPERFLPEQDDIPFFPAPLERTTLAGLTDEIARGVADRGRVLVVYPRRGPLEDTLRRLQTARAAVDPAAVAAHGSDLPPLAGAVLSALASALAFEVPSAGVLVSAFPRLEKELLVIARLGSLRGLEHPVPSIWQHLVSMMPGAHFGVSFWPQPSVRRLTRRDPVVPLPTLHNPKAAVAISGADGDVSWAEEVVTPALGPLPVNRVGVTPLGRSWWGTDKVIEAVIYPVDVPHIARTVTRDLVLLPCRSCGAAVGSRSCPFCGLELTSAQAVARA